MTVTVMALDRRPRPARIAFDRKSVRSFDRDGRLHVEVSHMAKAGVDQYLGEEIPDWKRLGLDPQKIYRLLRDPEELAAAVATFNNLPILREHIPVNSEEPQQELVIGSTGTDATFDGEFLDNSAVIWVQDDIDDIESETKRDWSPGYYYTPDMTAGKFNGLPYDGVMRNIVGNHVALVDEGRQGREVVVGDRKPEILKMAVLKSRRALFLQGAIAALIAPKLAMDAKVDLTGAFKGVSAKTRGKDADKIAAAIVKSTSPKLAQDAELEVSDVVAIINAVDGNDGTAPTEDEDEISDPADIDDGMTNDGDDTLSKVMAFLEGKLSDEDMAQLGAMVNGGDDQAEDEELDDADAEAKPAAKPMGLDAASIKKAVIREQQAIREAERAVAPHIGEVTVAMDSAASIYRLALDHAGVNLKGVPTSAYKAMVGMLPAPADASTAPILATDRRSSQKTFNERFAPNKLIAS
jgi:hypothetical protein